MFATEAGDPPPPPAREAYRESSSGVKERVEGDMGGAERAVEVRKDG
jgi:hypothetical protein